MSAPTTALVLVSHSRGLAAGLVDVAAQMAPDVTLHAAGGTDDGGIGTSYDLIEQGITSALETGAQGVLVLTDLGSATLTAESVLELLDDERVHLVNAPFVEATVAASVAAQGGGDLLAVVAAAGTAIDSFVNGRDRSVSGDTGTDHSDGPETEVPGPNGSDSGGSAGSEESGSDGPDSDGSVSDGPVVARRLTLTNSLGLHARPAATLARLAAGFDASVTVNGVDAASVLALMALGLAGGAEVEVSATGAQANEAVDALAIEIESGFGET